MNWKLYDYVNSKGINEIKAWTERLEKQQIALLNQKFDMLEQHGIDLLTGLVTNTRLNQIFELVFRGRVALRPLLCLGPTKDREGRYNREFTILFGAKEKDKKYEPKNALEQAEKRRQEVINTPNSKRCLHERVGE